MKSRRRDWRRGSLVIIAGLVLTLLGLMASAATWGALANGPDDPHTHFRFGHISWRRMGANTAEFAFIAGFRRCFEPGVDTAYPGSAPDGCPAVGDIIDEFIGGTTLCFGDAICTGQLRFKVFALNIEENWLLARALEPGSDTAETIKHAYPGPGPFTAFTASCCRTRAPKLINNASSPYRVETTVNFAGNRSSPRSLLPPIVECVLDSVCEFTVQAVDADGHRLRWRLSSSNEAGVGFIQPGPPFAPGAATIEQNSGRFRWDTLGASFNFDTETLYSVQVTIEDLDNNGNVLSKSAEDFFIRLEVPEPTPPMVLIPVRWCGFRDSPSMIDPGIVGETSQDDVLIARHTRANSVYLHPDNGANLVFFSGLVTKNGLIHSPIIDDPDPPPPAGTGPGGQGDVNIGDAREIARVVNACRSEWQDEAPEVTGITSVHIDKFVNIFGETFGLGLGGDPSFSNLAEQLLKGWSIMIDSGYLLEDTPLPKLGDDDKVVAHEFGHALSLEDLSVLRIGNLMNKLMELVGVKLDADQRTQIRDQALMHVPDRLTNPVIPPLGSMRVDDLDDVPADQAFVDINAVAMGIDLETQTVHFGLSTFGPISEEDTTSSFVFVADTDNNPGTGGVPTDVGVDATIRGVELVARIEVVFDDGVRITSPTIWTFDGVGFVEVMDTRISAEVVPDVAIVDTCEEEPCPDQSLPLGELAKLQIPAEIAGRLTEQVRIEVLARDNLSGVTDRLLAVFSLALPEFPRCRFDPSGVVLGGVANTSLSGFPPSSDLEVLLANEQVAAGQVNAEGGGTIQFTIPIDSLTGVQPVSVVVHDTGLAAGCALNVSAVPQFDVPPSPESGMAFDIVSGESISLAIQVSDAEQDDQVTVGVIGLPDGAQFEIPSPSNPAASTFVWKPTFADVGEHIIIFMASDQSGLSAPPHSVAIRVLEFEEVTIDIRPRKFPNIIELENDECEDDDKLPVAILTTPEFDALMVDASTVELGDPILSGTARPLRSRSRDLDRDGDRDLLMTFSICDLVSHRALEVSSTELVLTGRTFNGIPFTGSDTVQIVPEDD